MYPFFLNIYFIVFTLTLLSIYAVCRTSFFIGRVSSISWFSNDLATEKLKAIESYLMSKNNIDNVSPIVQINKIELTLPEAKKNVEFFTEVKNMKKESVKLSDVKQYDHSVVFHGTNLFVAINACATTDKFLLGKNEQIKNSPFKMSTGEQVADRGANNYTVSTFKAIENGRILNLDYSDSSKVFDYANNAATKYRKENLELNENAVTIPEDTEWLPIDSSKQEIYNTISKIPVIVQGYACGDNVMNIVQEQGEFCTQRVKIKQIFVPSEHVQMVQETLAGLNVDSVEVIAMPTDQTLGGLQENAKKILSKRKLTKDDIVPPSKVE